MLKQNTSIVFLFFISNYSHKIKFLFRWILSQTDHLKAYGITFHALEDGLKADWLLNYRGGSFIIDQSDKIVSECLLNEVLFEQISLAQASQIYAEVQSEDNNMDVVRLEKAPKIAVYVPPGFAPWDDAVTLVLEYAECKI